MTSKSGPPARKAVGDLLPVTMFVVGVLLAGQWIRRRDPRGVMVWPAAVALTTLPIAWNMTTSPGGGIPEATIRATALPRAPAHGGDAAPVCADLASGAHTPWVRLVGLEQSLALRGARLEEGAGEVRPVFARAAADHRERAAYDLDLQAEYELYRSVAAQPAEQSLLVSAAFPDAASVVRYDISIVRMQLDQEEATRIAQVRLTRLRAMSEAQLRSLRSRRPFLVPELAPMTQPFGPSMLDFEPPVTYNGVFYPHFHTGIDIAAPLETPVVAAADGVVLLAGSSVDAEGRLVGYGNYAMVGHRGGFLTVYGHLDRFVVHDGDLVQQGQVIGLEGSTGWSTGPHVHFEIRRDGRFLDPALFLQGQLVSQ